MTFPEGTFVASLVSHCFSPRNALRMPCQCMRSEYRRKSALWTFAHKRREYDAFTLTGNLLLKPR
jgi:hypothetical protein